MAVFKYAFKVFIIIVFFYKVNGDYSCLCNYNVEETIRDAPSVNSQTVGYLYEFDCKPLYPGFKANPMFDAIMYSNKVGYIEKNNGISLQVCQGSIAQADIVTASPTTLTPDTTIAMTTTTSSESTTVTMMKQSSTKAATLAASKSTQPTTSPSMMSSSKPTIGLTNAPIGIVISYNDTAVSTALNTSLFSTTHTPTTTTTPKPPSTTSSPTTTPTPASSTTTPTTASSTTTSPTTTPTTTSPTTTPTTTSSTTTSPTTTPTTTSPTTTPTTTSPTTTPTTTSPTTTPTTTSPTTTPTTVTQKPATQAPHCPDDWLMYDNSCYWFVFDNDGSWQHSRQVCQAHNAYLANMDSKAESDMMVNHLKHLHNGHGHWHVWFGLTDEDHEGQWIWTHSHRPLDQGYKNWADGEPDSGDGDHDEDCVCMVEQSDWQWHDYKCSHNYNFVCEKSALQSVGSPVMVG